MRQRSNPINGRKAPTPANHDSDSLRVKIPNEISAIPNSMIFKALI